MELIKGNERLAKVLRDHDTTWHFGDMMGTFIRLWGGLWAMMTLLLRRGEGKGGRVPFLGRIFGRTDTH